ncbi:unnamed protein product [Kuraishia capsulata CBS 1993]|uniref:4-nitrophenylphosphatase n=1 Tax=Kuraishia capsulata CBS 1993 TaxID=1382522 RepID=W6MUB7_9ASCO|nr:uncharacterized protein KUCA_T00005089001 [Kuraishia capsulata CBS 1993]CDK29102.1 unnamed protein product [Kuraishia capsulata CBS 1993]
MSQKLTTKQEVEQFLSQYDTFLFDCDGVLWLGTHILPKVVETLTLLRSLGKKLIFVTNNSTKSRREYTQKFEKFGLTVTAEEIFGSAFASAVYLKNVAKLPKEKSKVWVLGQSGIEEELAEVGIESLGGSNQALDEEFTTESPFLKLDPEVGAVIAGLDTKVNYHRLAITLQYLLQPDVKFIATNIDSTYPQKGMILPGAGSIIESVAFASGRTPVACGKPNQAMMEAIVAQHGFDKKRACMVGDRLNTDMKFGRDGGLGTLLVLTGIETVDKIHALEASEQPLYFADKLGDIFELLQ